MFYKFPCANFLLVLNLQAIKIFKDDFLFNDHCRISYNYEFIIFDYH